MSSVYSVSYELTHYLEYKAPTIHWKNNIDSIIELLRELNWRSQRVLTTLGGGKIGYLFIVLSILHYSKIVHFKVFNFLLDPGNSTRTAVDINTCYISGSTSTPEEPATAKINSIKTKYFIQNVKQSKLHCEIK